MQNLPFLQLDGDVSYQTYMYKLKVLLSVSPSPVHAVQIRTMWFAKL